MVYEKEINVLTNKQGVKGDSGVGISSITNYYLATNSTSVTTSTTGWTTTIQTVSETKKYLWNYEKITYTDNTKKSTTPVIIGNYSANGTDGADGKDGSDGIGIKSIAEKYAISTSNTTAPTTWKDTPQQMTATNKYLWNYEIITYTNNTTEETAKRVIGAYGDKGATGEQGLRGSLEFSGTEINAISDITEAKYTITTASTGITSATMPILVGDTYVNVTTQDVWICSTAGTPTTAKWKYQGRRCSDKDDSNRFRMFTPATDNGTMQNSITKSVVKGENPFGKIDNLLKITNTNATSASYYTPYYRRTKIDPKKTYRHVTYIKQEDAKYIDYIGIARWEPKNSFCLSLSGSPINSAYFTSASNFGTLGRWYMVVGYIVANGTTTAPADSGVYDIETKQKVRDVNNFQWKPNVTYCNNNGCLIRNTDDVSTKTGSAYLYDVRLDEVNGTEPTLNELLNLDTTTKSKGTWAASTIYNTGDIVYINGNSYICTANHTSGTSFSTTNWNLVASKGADGKDGADGKNAITMTSATTPNGEYNGQIGFWQGQLYQWDSSSWVLTSGILPTDPVLHYSFDDDINGYTPVVIDSSTISADNNNGTLTLENKNNLLMNFTKETLQMFQVAFTIHGLTTGANLSFDIETNNESYAYVIYNSGGSYIKDGVLDLTQKHLVYKYNGNNSRIILQIYSGKTGQYCNLKNISFVKPKNNPIINNVDGKSNGVNNRGISVKGVNSNAVRLYKDSSVEAYFTTPQNFSVSIWCKPENNTTGVTQNIVYSNSIIIRNGAAWGNYLMAYCFTQLADGTFDSTILRSPTKGLLDLNRFTHIVLTKDKNILKLYIDGKLESSQTRYSELMRKTNVIYIGDSNNSRGQDLDDFQIFDRALSDQEVLGLYLARGNTPKQYTMADYQLDNSSGKYYGYEKPAVPFKNDTYLDTTIGYLYEYDGVKWVAITDVTDSRYNQAVNDMVAFAENNPTLPFLTARNAWIERLAVDGLLANKIATQKLILRENGVIKSSNYVEGQSGFLITSDGNAEFYKGRFRGGLGNIKRLSTTNSIRLKVSGVTRLIIFQQILIGESGLPLSNELGRPIADLLLTERIDYKAGTVAMSGRKTSMTGDFFTPIEAVNTLNEEGWVFPEIILQKPSTGVYEYWGCFEQLGPENILIED